MRQAAIDRRVAHTRQRLHRSLGSLLQRKRYEAITVAAICAEAGVGRSTFYAHYTGKDDLKVRALDRLGHALASGAAGHPPPSFAFVEAFFAHAADHLPQLCVHAGGRQAELALERVRGLLAEQVRREVARLAPSERERAAQTAFLVGALMGLFAWWLEDGARRPPADVAQLFRSLAGFEAAAGRP